MAVRTKTRRRAASCITLPGGAKLTFRGYLPPKACPGECCIAWDAAAYVKTVKANSNGRRYMLFGPYCLLCDPPAELPRDLHGVRPSGYTDATGVIVGWRQRSRDGYFGDVLPLECMGLRKTADGVWRPQPKLDRRSKAQQLARPHEPRRYRAVTDRRRCFPRPVVAAAARAQHNLCPACGAPFTDSKPAVGDHIVPYADGGPTTPDNCMALHARCNSAKGRRNLQQYRRDQRLRRGLFDS